MSARDIVYTALFAAIVAALGLLPAVPIPLIPAAITAQSMGVMLAGSILGARRAGAALLLFTLLVAAGLPVLAGGRGGLGALLGATGGFFLSWPLAAFVVGLLVERWWRGLTLWRAVAANVIGGICVVYLIGIPWMAVVASMRLEEAALGSAAFVPGDLAKAVVAGLLALEVKRSYPVIDAQGQ